MLDQRTPPTHQAGNTLLRGAACVYGGQRPISLEYQIYLPAIDTLVTGMALQAIIRKLSKLYMSSLLPQSSPTPSLTSANMDFL